MRIVVFGLGLLGGSVCRALRAVDDGVHISAFDIDGFSLLSAKKEGAIDQIIENLKSDIDADCVIVALPVMQSAGVIRDVLDRTGDTTLVVDTGSVKKGVIDAVADHPGSRRFVPCHPMAGSEHSGFDHSRADLFDNASVLMTPHEKNSPDMIKRARELWEKIGCGVAILDPVEHDRSVAVTSHMPHIVSCAIARSVIGGKIPAAGFESFRGRGLLDMTRLAGGSPSMWSEICEMNAPAIVDALDRTMELLMEARENLLAGERVRPLMEKYLIKSVQARKEIEHA